ncbi:MAG: hypothetical protein FMNOHCHN_00390 [Ignavibacteriaceae bacterium]|nr:hypothetical protein [Ignavibacteriaceae bacterium]
MNTKISFTLLITLLPLLQFAIFPQAGTYYDALNTGSASFVDSLKSRIRSPYTRVSYDNFDETNIANFAAVDNGDGSKSVFCVYSSYEFIYTGTFAWTTMSREHTFCHSWMPSHPSTSTNEYADQHHLYPTHQNNANGRRSNHPLEKVVNITYQFLDGKLGTNNAAKVVYEPRHQQKGDAARALLYMMVRYDGLNGYTWNFNWLNGTRLPALSEAPQNLDTLLAWHRLDPPDKYEIDRNNYIQSIQQNRNPFIDRPEYVNYINFNSLAKLSPSYAAEPSAYASGFSATPAGSTVNLNWTDASGSQLPSGYLIVAYNKNDYFLPIDGEVYTDEEDFSDGRAVKNIAYSASNEYSFTGLTPGKTYYFTIYSYNGDGSQRNYKINGTLVQANAEVTNSNTTVQFAAASLTTGEGSAACTLTVSITNPSPVLATTADVLLISGSASDLGNYTTQAVTFPANSSANQTVIVTITDDDMFEGDETFVFELQNISGGSSATVGSAGQFVLTLTDNDITTVQFAASSASVSEGSGTYNLALTIAAPSATEATVATVELVSGSSAAVNNFTSQQVTFPAGSSSNQTILLTIVDDEQFSSNELLEFSIESVTGGNNAITGSTSLFTLTIQEDDPNGQIWSYDFGTGTGSYTTSNTVSTSFLPAPPENGGTSRIRVSNGAGGGFYLENPGSTLGGETELRVVASSSTSVNKFSIYDYSPSKYINIKFDIRFGGGSSGTWYFFAGDGAIYSDNSGFSGAQVFSGLRWVFGASDVITFNNRAGASWNSTGITGTPFAQNINYTVEIFGNNSPSLVTYTYGSSNSIAADKFDLWVNGVLIGNDLAKGALASDANIDSWMFYGENSTGNVANIYLDNIFYSNKMPDNPLPVELTSFTGAYSGEAVVLKWNTATEVNNYGFEIERSNLVETMHASSLQGQSWKNIGFIPGYGNSNSPKSYIYTDRAATGGDFLYRLKQIDTDGSYSYSPVIEVRGYSPGLFTVKQNYPNPFNPSTVIRFFFPEPADYTFTVYNITGAAVYRETAPQLQAGWHETIFEAGALASGSYFYEIRSAGNIYRGRMLLLK